MSDAITTPGGKPIVDKLGRPLREGSVVFIIATSETGRVIDRTANRRSMVNVQRGDGRIVAFYGSSLWLR
jgi:hypothetical protein